MLAAIDVLPRILIIDDDQSLLESYTVLLEDEFQVSTAESGESGLDLLRHEDVHLVCLTSAYQTSTASKSYAASRR